MIFQHIYLEKYDWLVSIYYAVDTYWSDRILHDLSEIGCTGRDFSKARINLESGRLDTGLTFSNPRFRESVLVIALTSSPEEFASSFDHEKGHLARQICQAFDIDPYGEEAQYLAGDINKKMFPVAKKFLCEHCRRELGIA
ncbi:MAG: hypothetical protein IAB99_07250 [Bacteroidetes bacterium]|uniref:Uncharacterized protein n=1 Tax=Candidatus Cryptobacteroides faecipullorum TaxID=2840764 RepID=A0A9D9I956_9BACT|nr:hypothetical protein [Candidatus Cryptobacteroides faecipullorum]